MSITLTTLRTELQEKLGSTANIKADALKQTSVINRSLDKLQLLANWMFTIRKTTFDYLPDLFEYSVTNYLGLTDFKQPYRVAGKALSLNDIRRFNHKFENYGYSIKDNDYFLSINLDGGNTRTVDGLYSLTADGTWSTSGDAESLVADTKEYKEGSGSLKFDIDVSNTANNYAGIKNTTKNEQNLTDYEDRSYFLLWVYLPTTTSVTNVEVIWGSDTSNYWSGTATAPVDSGSFQTGWNQVVIDWSDATETSSPDVTAIDYVEIRINYAAAMVDTSNVRFNSLRLNIREQVDLEYFSQHMVVTSGGTYQSRFSASADIFLGGIELKPLLLEMALFELLRETKGKDKQELRTAREELEIMKFQAIQAYAYTRSKGTNRIMTKL